MSGIPWHIELVEIWRVMISLALILVFSLQIIVLYEWREIRRNAERREQSIRETVDGIRKDRAEFLASLANLGRFAVVAGRKGGDTMHDRR